MFYSGLPVTQEALNEVAEVSGVMTFGEDHYRCRWYQTHGCSTFISIFEGSLQPGAHNLASRLFLIQLKRCSTCRKCPWIELLYNVHYVTSMSQPIKQKEKLDEKALIRQEPFVPCHNTYYKGGLPWMCQYL